MVGHVVGAASHHCQHCSTVVQSVVGASNGMTAWQPILGAFGPRFGSTSVTMHLARNGSRSG